MPTTLITGASSGLGAEMARQFAARGWDLALAARRTERLEGAARRDPRGPPGPPGRAARPRRHRRRPGLRGLPRLPRRLRHASTGSSSTPGLGKGAPIGTGRYDANRQTAMTNFVAALAQTEAAMEIFRAQKRGHLVMISSVSAMRGMRKTMTTYAATKAGVAHLAEGLRNEMLGEPDLDIRVSTIYPGYIRSEMNERVEEDAVHGRHRDGRARDGRRDREGEGQRPASRRGRGCRWARRCATCRCRSSGRSCDRGTRPGHRPAARATGRPGSPPPATR